mmetsp:Transcript_18408/g.47148  ORF Transcript_18408/g.47148 Transcript_18408/m.47148 type:complete len:212 (+) Transcript_18408:743-1378(+)
MIVPSSTSASSVSTLTLSVFRPRRSAASLGGEPLPSPSSSSTSRAELATDARSTPLSDISQSASAMRAPTSSTSAPSCWNDRCAGASSRSGAAMASSSIRLLLLLQRTGDGSSSSFPGCSAMEGHQVAADVLASGAGGSSDGPPKPSGGMAPLMEGGAGLLLPEKLGGWSLAMGPSILRLSVRAAGTLFSPLSDRSPGGPGEGDSGGTRPP